MLPLSSEKIKSLLPENGKGIDIIVYDTVDSTNNEAKRLFKSGGNDMLICSETQTAGRGRHGKSFYSPEKTGIYMSIVIHPDLSLNSASKVTVATAVAVCESIENLTDKKPKIKWVNDIFLDGKKICGILAQAISSIEKTKADGLVIGIGINVSTVDFPDEIKETASSLNDGLIDRNILIADIFKRVIACTKDLENPSIIENYKKRCFILGREITFEKNGSRFEATAVDIDKSAGLIVKTTDGEMMTLKSGEISVKTK